ncbi:MAG: DUF4922 domain-containing protein [Melioribacteraceae bacterium]|nr:DUF4922 domain-containing protein [Melioribacteraceae bacterium]
MLVVDGRVPEFGSYGGYITVGAEMRFFTDQARKPIAERACFLCKQNLPEVQKGINFKNEYIILCNPYPIFSQHLTIPYFNHIPQNINVSFKALLELSFELREKFFVFYNGPKCGASAPDHLHLQAGIKKYTPLEEYYHNLLEDGIKLYNDSETKIIWVDQDLFKFISVQSNNQVEIEKYVGRMIDQLKDIQANDEEPLLNIISIYENNRWNIIFIPRKKHRPAEFFLEEEKKMLISPASVDMTGLLITPRKIDFDRIDKSIISSIYDQVLLDRPQFESIKKIF